MAWAGLAVLWCALMGIPIVPWLALLTANTHCVVLASLANTGLGLTDLGVAMAVATFTGAQVEAAGHACVACATFLAGRAAVPEGTGTLLYFQC